MLHKEQKHNVVNIYYIHKNKLTFTIYKNGMKEYQNH